MISPGLFMLAHLAIILAVLVGVVLNERHGRRSWPRWHRGVRTRRLTTEELQRRLRNASRRGSIKAESGFLDPL